MKDTSEKVTEKIKKLLALSKNNPSEEEANSALLKAQAMMAEYDISIDECEPDKITYGEERCEHKWNMGYRKPLANVIATNFRCEVYYHGGSVIFFGHKMDAKIAKEAFEFAYKYAMVAGNKLYNQAYADGTETRGLFNSYCAGFIKGLKTKLDEQCTALKLVTPQDVIDSFKEMTAGWKELKGGMRRDNFHPDAFAAGVQDGKTVLNGRRIGGDVSVS